MSGVGFFSKSINPYPAIPIRYRLPEIVHFKATEILSTDLIFVREWYRETGKVRRRGKLPVWLTTSGFWMVTSGGSVLNKALKRIAQWCKYQIQIRGNNFLKVKHFDSETAIFMIIQVILKIKNININKPEKKLILKNSDGGRLKFIKHWPRRTKFVPRALIWFVYQTLWLIWVEWI